MPKYLNARQAAKRLGVTDRTVRNWIKSGRLRAEKHGRAFRIREDAIGKIEDERLEQIGHVEAPPSQFISAPFAPELSQEEQIELDKAIKYMRKMISVMDDQNRTVEQIVQFYLSLIKCDRLLRLAPGNPSYKELGHRVRLLISTMEKHLGRYCRSCNSHFFPTHGRQIYCSKKCSAREKNRRYYAKRKAREEPP
jgi:excisionase family DNA binding protein